MINDVGGEFELLSIQDCIFDYYTVHNKDGFSGRAVECHVYYIGYL